ncbi:MAG: 5-formyltetrahydrofolate cyclo-ligase [Pseudomonadota bacterium]
MAEANADAKKALRDAMKPLREEMSARDPDGGEKLAERFPLKLLERYGPAVSGYWPIGSEIDPRPLMARLSGAGATLCLPRVHDDGAGLSFHRWQPGDPLVAGRFGLQEPAPDAALVQPTLMLLPLLAFDLEGNRLGYGKGHYDRTIAGLRASTRVFTCGLGFSGQQVDHVPRAPHDAPLDWAVTEAGSVPLFMTRTLRRDGDAPGGDGPSAA